MNIRTAVLYKKNLALLTDESVSAADLLSSVCARVAHAGLRRSQGIAGYPSMVPTYLTAAAPPPREPSRMMCTVCGYWGKYRCKKCGMACCDKICEGVHDETRCERRVV